MVGISFCLNFGWDGTDALNPSEAVGRLNLFRNPFAGLKGLAVVHFFEVGVGFVFGMVEVVERLSAPSGESLKDCAIIVDVVCEAVAVLVVVGLNCVETCVEN